jgi:uncharacterized protein YodC (DUF2158 family)
MKFNERKRVSPQPKIKAMENKYKTGEVVCERIHPTQILIISKYVNGIYYARATDRKSKKELVFLETELKSFSTPAEFRMNTGRDWPFSFQFPTLLKLWRAVSY